MEEFKSLPSNINTNDDLLKFLFIKEGSDIIKYNKLSEGIKNRITNEVLNSIIKLTKNKANQVDLAAIEVTRGDITKLRNYKDLENSIKYLMSMYNHAKKDKPEEIPELYNCLDNIKKFKRNFEEGFKNDSELIQLLYNSVVMALIKATSYVVASTIDYITDITGKSKAAFRSNIQKKKEMNLYYDNIKKFNKFALKGQLDTFTKNSKEGKFAIGVVGAVAYTVMGLIAFVWIIRELIYVYYLAKVNISESLKALADFVRINTYSLDDDNEQVRKKQEKVVETLIKLSDKIAVDVKVSDKKAKSELDKENKDTDLDKAVDSSVNL